MPDSGSGDRSRTPDGTRKKPRNPQPLGQQGPVPPGLDLAATSAFLTRAEHDEARKKDIDSLQATLMASVQASIMANNATLASNIVSTIAP